MFKFSQLFSKQKDDKIIIMGKSGSGKSFMAMQLDRLGIKTIFRKRKRLPKGGLFSYKNFSNN